MLFTSVKQTERTDRETKNVFMFGKRFCVSKKELYSKWQPFRARPDWAYEFPDRTDSPDLADFPDFRTRRDVR